MQQLIKMKFSERSLFFAEMSAYAYLDNSEIKEKISDSEFQLLNAYDTDGSQAYSFASDTDLIIACRGTEADCWADIRADLRAWPEKSPYGRVHSGFSWHVDKIWEKIIADLEIAKERGLKIWFTGHSLGAAMTTILASRCWHCDNLPNPVQLYTYGSPRVGWKKYVNTLAVNHIRWVNNNDIVAHVPPCFLGYRHHGSQYYLNTWGNVRSPSGWQRIKDKIRGMVLSWKDGEVDSFTDHSITQYINHLQNYSDDLENLQYPIFSSKSK